MCCTRAAGSTSPTLRGTRSTCSTCMRWLRSPTTPATWNAPPSSSSTAYLTGRFFPVEPSSRHIRDALQTFYRVVSEGTLRHRGDSVIAAHLANCAVERGHRDEIRRVRKIDDRKPIDAVPAVALAVWRATLAQAPVPDLIVL
jgi:hypothetical protein